MIMKEFVFKREIWNLWTLPWCEFQYPKFPPHFPALQWGLHIFSVSGPTLWILDQMGPLQTSDLSLPWNCQRMGALTYHSPQQGLHSCNLDEFCMAALCKLRMQRFWTFSLQILNRFASQCPGEGSTYHWRILVEWYSLKHVKKVYWGTDIVWTSHLGLIGRQQTTKTFKTTLRPYYLQQFGLYNIRRIQIV